MRAGGMMILLIAASLVCRAQINVALLHQLVDNNRSEHSRQSTLRDQQASSSATAVANSLQAKTLKSTYRNIQNKFSSIGLAIQTVQIGMEALPLIEKITSDQRRLIAICQDEPRLILIAIDTQVDLFDRSQMLLRYIYALALSAGELGAMSRADRTMLSRFIIDELHGISLTLSGLIRTIAVSKTRLRSQKTLFSQAVQKDKQLSDQIISKIKQLKK